MNKLHLLIVVILIGFSCKSCNNKKDTNNIYLININKDYKLWKNEFPDSLTTHFPDKIDDNFISYASSYRNEPKEFLYLSLEKKLTSDEMKEISKKRPDEPKIKVISSRVQGYFLLLT